MKAGIGFTGSGPLVILTSCESFTDPKLVLSLKLRGLKSIWAVELCQKSYGEHYRLVRQEQQWRRILAGTPPQGGTSDE